MNIEKIRKDTIGCENKVFFNSAGSSLIPSSVNKKIISYLQREEMEGGYSTHSIFNEEINQFYNEAAYLINTSPCNIAYTHSATDAYTKALSSINFSFNDVIITSDDDYASNQIQFLSLKKRFGIIIKRIKTLDNGELDLEDFNKLISNYNPKLIAITHIPTNSGLIQNVKEIGKKCYEKDIIFLLDACQSLGQIKVDVKEIKCDFLTATGRKFLRGPRGSGFLFVSDKLLNRGYSPLFVDGFGAKWTKKNSFKILNSAKRFETFENSCALKVGFIETLKYLNQIGIENIQNYNSSLMRQLRNNLTSIPNVKLFDNGLNKGSILTFEKSNKSLESVSKKLKEHNIYFSISNRNWGVIDFNKKGIEAVVRLSPHYFNTLKEINFVSEIIENM